MTRWSSVRAREASTRRRVIVVSGLSSASVVRGEGPAIQEGITVRSEPSYWLLPIAIVAGAAIPVPALASDLNLYPDVTTVATNIALFLLLIYPVNRLLVQPLLQVLDEREARTSGALTQASRLGEEARAARIAIEARLVEARAAAQLRRNAILADGEPRERAVLEAARADANGIVESVRTSVQAELAEARGALPADARALAREAAARILGRAL